MSSLFKFMGVLGFLALLSSCSVEPVKINYGADSCDFCRMTIVDEQHAAEAVTTKGRATKYDAIECMINHLRKEEMKDVEMQYLLVDDYNNPGVLIDANKAHFLISDGISSPMGANLSGFSKAEDAQSAVDEFGGEIYNWEEIKEEIAH